MILDLEKKYHAKLLLFGEYLVLQGSDAFAVPLDRFYGQFKLDTSEKRGFAPDLLQKLAKLPVAQAQFDFPSFEKAIDQGLIFDSNIPRGYGMGSSGALSAALYDQFFFKLAPTFIDDRSNLALIESIFQGKSSGTDPLVSYYNTAIHIQNGKINKELVYDKFLLKNWFLFDSKVPRKTHTLLEIFKTKLQNSEYSTQIDHLTKENNLLIQHFIHNANEFSKLLNKFSSSQQFLFSDMIIEGLEPMWSQGLSSKVYQMKLCGAGGGGYYLLYSADMAILNKNYPSLDAILIPVIDESL